MAQAISHVFFIEKELVFQISVWADYKRKVQGDNGVIRRNFKWKFVDVKNDREIDVENWC